MMKAVDRIVGETAVIDDNGEIFQIPLSAIEKGVREGDILIQCGGIYKIDKKSTDERRKSIKKLEDSLWK